MRKGNLVSSGRKPTIKRSISAVSNTAGAATMVNIKHVANLFLSLDSQHEGEGLSNLKLQKLAYYAQGFYTAIFDKVLFDDEIQAWTHGPVVPVLYHKYKSYGSNGIPCPLDFDSSVFSRDEIELIEEVFEVFGQYSAWKLRNMTHEEAPWARHESTAGTIPINEIKEYFKTRIV